MECDNNCASCSQDCPSAPATEKLNDLSRVSKVIGVVSGKGGVGKSLVTSLLAVMLQRRGNTVGILDADITGPSIPNAFNIHEKATGNEIGIFPAISKTGIQVMSINMLLENETDPVVWRGPVVSGVVKQFWTDVIWKDVDVLLVDMPPGTGDVPLTVYQSLPLDGIVVVTTPQTMVGMVVEKSVRMAEMLNIPVLALVENMSYLEQNGEKLEVFGPSHVKEWAEKFHATESARLPLVPNIAAAVDQGLIELFDGDWLEDVADVLESAPVLCSGKPVLCSGSPVLE